MSRASVHSEAARPAPGALTCNPGLADRAVGRLRSACREIPNILPALNARLRLRSAEWHGWRVRLWGQPYVANAGRISLGDHVRLDSTVARIELRTLPGGHLELGDNVFINYGSSLVASSHVKIGEDCLLGPQVMIWDTDYHRVEDKAWEPSGVPVVLEDRVWVGARATILKGVTIGHDAVIAAGAVVTKDVPARSVAAGVPARVIRKF